MLVSSSRVQPEPVAAPGKALAEAVGRLFSAWVRPLALPGRWLMHHRYRWSRVAHPWSAEDVVMVIVWLLTMPYAATRFERDILSPPLAHLPVATSFFVASAAALMELTVAAMAARMVAATMRQALQRVLRRCGRHRYARWASGKTQHHAGSPVRFG
jgi:hypothetical protein